VTISPRSGRRRDLRPLCAHSLLGEDLVAAAKKGHFRPLTTTNSTAPVGDAEGEGLARAFAPPHPPSPLRGQDAYPSPFSGMSAGEVRPRAASDRTRFKKLSDVWRP